MRIIADVMGGDNAPGELVLGAVEAASEFGVEIVLVGRGEEILGVLKDAGYSDIPKGLEIAHASQVIEMDESPAAAIREKKDSSIVVGLNMLGAGGGDAFISAGSTGALLTGSTLIAKRIRGIRRAALAPFLPTKTGKALLIDCGANVECLPEYLLQFGYMGSLYAEKVMGIKKPRVGLLNVGTEDTKGGSLQKGAFALLKEASDQGRLNFVGNVEARDIVFGATDVVVTDGFTGNILLKSVEGAGLFFVDLLKGIFKKNLITKLSALMVKGGLTEFKKLLDYTETGGAPLVGISKPIIKAHGSSNAHAFRSAIKQAIAFCQSGIIEDIEKNISYMKINSEE